MKKITVLIVIALLFPALASAEYIVNGKVRGEVCSGFVIEACSFHNVDAVGDDLDHLSTIKRRYNNVSNYSSSKRLCWINTKSKGLGLWSSAINAVSDPVFWEKKNHSYEKIDVEYIVFPCIKSKR